MCAFVRITPRLFTKTPLPLSPFMGLAALVEQRIFTSAERVAMLISENENAGEGGMSATSLLVWIGAVGISFAMSVEGTLAGSASLAAGSLSGTGSSSSISGRIEAISTGANGIFGAV